MVSVTFLLGSFTLLSNVLATVYMTSPTAQTTCTGGKQCSIAWNDDGKPPSLAQFGMADVGVWVGSVTAQTQVQHIQAGVNVSTTAAIQFTIDPSVGPNGNFYFVRFTSASFQDPTTLYPAEAFSAKFALTGMSGTLNSTVQAEISGASSNPIPSPSALTSAPASSTSAPAKTSSGSSSKSSQTASPAGAAKGAAMSLSVRDSMMGLLASGVLFALAF